MVFTDPPYLMDFNGAIGGDGIENKRHAPIINDKMSKEDGEKFLIDVSKTIRMFCNGAWYVSFYRLGIDDLFRAMAAAGLKWRSLIIWKKNHFNLSASDYKSIYEPIITGYSDDYTPMLYGWNLEHKFHGRKGETDVWEIEIPSVWEINRTKKNDLHPTMKPVELCERAILNSSKRQQIVLDLFGGSGSTLIACEKNKRRARLMELDPKYCDVIIERWQEFTGGKARHEDGRIFNEKGE
jgi:DNA modification methylase